MFAKIKNNDYFESTEETYNNTTTNIVSTIL